MEPLTDRQQQILEYIQKTIQERGYSPSIREIGKQFKIKSPNGVSDHLKALREKDYLEPSEERHRGLKLKSWRPNMQIPLLGQVQAGLPILAEQNIESYITVDRALIRSGGKLFSLKVKGDSMEEAGIFEGDTVIIRQQETAQSGEVVVALKEGEATVKYYRQRRGQPYLEPANPAYSPMAANGFEIIGKVVGLVRSYTN